MAIIGIDFDGTCVTDLFPYIGDNIGAASVLRKLADKNLLILYTVRDGKYLQDAVDWFKYNHINLYSVNYNPEPVSSSPKLYCDYYIDDRNIGTPLTDKGYAFMNRMFIPIRPGWIDGNAKIANMIVLSNLLAIFFVILYQLSSPVKVPISVLHGLILIPAS